MIKHLTKDDIPYCLSVISAEHKISGTTPLDSNRQINYLDYCIDNPTKYSVLGYFENDQLISWIIDTFIVCLKKFLKCTKLSGQRRIR